MQVTMTVDGTYREKWTTSGTFSMLSSNKVFIGGSSQPYKLPGANTKTNFVGCMKKVCFYPWWAPSESGTSELYLVWWAQNTLGFHFVEVTNSTDYREPTPRQTLLVAWRRYVFTFDEPLRNQRCQNYI